MNERPSETLRALRGLLRTYRRPVTWMGLSICAADLLLYGVSMGGVLSTAGASRLAWGALHAVSVPMLLLVGHDCAHGSFLGYPRLQAFLGRLSMLPSLTPYASWIVAHNARHHGHTGLRKMDNACPPLSCEEYARAGRASRWLERVYRTPWGHGLEYMITVWWPQLFFPDREFRTEGLPHTRDGLLVVAYVAGVIGLSVIVGGPGWSSALSAALLVVVPFLVACWFLGFLSFVQHTHADKSWIEPGGEWSFAASGLDHTVELRVGSLLTVLTHGIMYHNAHHIDPAIPMYRLSGAQRLIRERYGERITITTLRGYLRSIRHCKLYDTEHRRWLPFPKRTTLTSPPLLTGGDRPVPARERALEQEGRAW